MLFLRIFVISCFCVLSLFADDVEDAIMHQNSTYKDSESYVDITTVEVDDVVIGDKNAPITVILYDSLACPHCADFNLNSYEIVKKRYIDSGIVRLIHRPFPFFSVDFKLELILKCFESDVDFSQKLRIALFQKQRRWIFQKDDDARIDTAKKILASSNISNEKMDMCMMNEQNKEKVLKSRFNAIKSGLTATPVFYINGVKYEGSKDFNELSKIFEEILDNRN